MASGLCPRKWLSTKPTPHSFPLDSQHEDRMARCNFHCLKSERILMFLIIFLSTVAPSLLMKTEFLIPGTFEAFHKLAMYLHFCDLGRKCGKIYFLHYVHFSPFRERIGKCCDKINLPSGMGSPSGQGRLKLVLFCLLVYL